MTAAGPQVPDLDQLPAAVAAAKNRLNRLRAKYPRMKAGLALGIPDSPPWLVPNPAPPPSGPAGWSCWKHPRGLPKPLGNLDDLQTLTITTQMETLSPGDRVVAINFMPVPLYPDGDCSRHPFLLPNGPLRRDVIYHVAATVMRPDNRQGVIITGLRITWGSQEIPWASGKSMPCATVRRRNARKATLSPSRQKTACLPPGNRQKGRNRWRLLNSL